MEKVSTICNIFGNISCFGINNIFSKKKTIIEYKLFCAFVCDIPLRDE